MLTDKDAATANTRSRSSSIRDAYSFRDGRLRRPDPARHDLSRALGLHLAARPADRRRRRRRRCDPPAGARAGPRRAAVPGRADRARRAARPAGLRQRRRRAALVQATTRTTSSTTSARPGIGPLAGWRGADGDAAGQGAPNPNQLERYIDNGCFWRDELPPEQRYFKHANRAYLDSAKAMGCIASAPSRSSCSSMSETLQSFRLAAQGHGARQPPDTAARAHRDLFRPAAVLVRAARSSRRIDRERFPLHAITQRPMAMYHSWDSQNAWLRQILGHNWLYMNRAHGARRWGSPTTTGSGSRAAAGRSRCQLAADGGRQPRHGVDLERDRQAQRRLGPRAGRAGSRRRASCSTT